MDACDVAIAGGGPAGLVAGLILARAGLRVTVLEKHADFLRDFRGDTVHPSTLTLLDELGLGDGFARLGAQRVRGASIPVAGGGPPVTVADLSRLRVRHPYIEMAPQWDVLNLLAEAASAEPGFELRMNAEVLGPVVEGGAVRGVRYAEGGPSAGPGSERELRATVTLVCDGRGSVLRREAGLVPRSWPVPFDVWWVRVPGSSALSDTLAPRGGRGLMYVLIPRGEYVQAAMLFPRGSGPELLAGGMEALRERFARDLPELAGGFGGMAEEDLKFLHVELSRLRTWYRRGLICLGDAAHTMSPVGGVGVNLAIQDGAAAGRLLAPGLLDGTLSDRDAQGLQRRRAPVAAATQAAQRLMHRGVARLLRSDAELALPRPAARVLRSAPALAAVPAWLLGVGPRPEHAPDFARR